MGNPEVVFGKRKYDFRTAEFVAGNRQLVLMGRRCLMQNQASSNTRHSGEGRNPGRQSRDMLNLLDPGLRRGDERSGTGYTPAEINRVPI